MERINISDIQFTNLIKTGMGQQVAQFLTEYVERALRDEIKLSINGVVQYEPELEILKKRLKGTLNMLLI